MIIDFHTHTFPDTIAHKVIPNLAMCSTTKPYTDGTMGGLFQSMKEAGISISINLPVATSADKVTSLNESLTPFTHNDKYSVITFAGMHPDCKNYAKELRSIKSRGFLGIKLHPAYQGADFDDIRYMRILEEAASLELITVIHAGIDIGIRDHNYSSVNQILHVLKEVAPQKLVLAHMGGWADWAHVESDLCGADVYFDAAFTIGPIEPYPGAKSHEYSQCTLTDDAFVRIARKHGMNKLLFATDSPWQSQKRYAERFGTFDFTETELSQFFYENAASLLDLEKG